MATVWQALSQSASQDPANPLFLDLLTVLYTFGGDQSYTALPASTQQIIQDMTTQQVTSGTSIPTTPPTITSMFPPVLIPNAPTTVTVYGSDLSSSVIIAT